MSFTNRAGMNAVGLNHVVPYVLLYVSGTLEFVTLYRSMPDVGARPAEAQDLCHAEVELAHPIAVLLPRIEQVHGRRGRPPESGRPSVCAATALGTAQFDRISGPGRLCHVALT